MKYEMKLKTIISNKIISINRETRQKIKTSEKSRVRVIHDLNFEIDNKFEININDRCISLNTAKTRSSRYNRESQINCLMRFNVFELSI